MANETASIEIVRLDQGRAGTYQAHTAGTEAVGSLTWSEHDSPAGTVRVAESTQVPPELAGRGIAAKLVAALIEDAQSQGFKVDPQCSYVAAQFKRHPEWADLLA